MDPEDVATGLVKPGDDDELVTAGKAMESFRRPCLHCQPHIGRPLRPLAGRLAARGCTHVAMESTGVYWRPVWNVLDDDVVLILANAREVKAVPGRKTDVKDCEWLADLLAHGLVRASFVPPAPIRELRELTRYRKTVIRSRVAEANRVHKLLETANIKLAPVVSDVLGASGRAMLRALVRGERDPRALAQLARGVMRRKESRLIAALEGRFATHHAVLLEHLLGHLEYLEYLEQLIATLDRQIADLVAPFQRQLDLLRTIPGVEQRTAEVLIAEMGVDMDRFGTAGRLASWAGVCPGNNESAGKRRSGRTRRGDRWLRTALIEAGWAAARTRGTYLAGLYARLARRRGPKKAVVAVGHSILVSAFYLLSRGVAYADVGARHFDRLQATRQIRYHLRRLQELGHPLPETATA